ncbi:hypothetical protein Salmuc_02370 [Salipiger mucosus DSM 16094]|uniref:Uncharacterized protein n=1 Tax=Salipiger mucosus DSM 16094 TaxID=1123237 RepID=S9RVH1_9RHOB|nr:hypothetical protein Salmuc_02370 [Salipiger mucosus DSM 16094]
MAGRAGVHVLRLARALGRGSRGHPHREQVGSDSMQSHGPSPYAPGTKACRQGDFTRARRRVP